MMKSENMGVTKIMDMAELGAIKEFIPDTLNFCLPGIFASLPAQSGQKCLRSEPQKTEIYSGTSIKAEI
ncbi:MAG: hypothetical protein Q4C96_07790 [Planctomycetia bacterium]|nr:hypothetical protein [Planctomycetia bacterium]